ncbi:hypothetical protein ACWC24_36115 [Streptomyces sp. NPDC001443]
MSSTDLSPLPLLAAATDLVRRRAAHLGTEAAPAGPVTVVLDEAADLVQDPAARDLLTELLTVGRAVGVHVQARSRLPRQYATLTELEGAVSRGER